MDDHNITMKEYIRLEKEKARWCGKMYNWEIATCGRIWYDDDVHDLRFVETEFSAIVFNNKLMSEVALSYETTISSLDDNKNDFRISFDESNDEDYMYDEDVHHLRSVEIKFSAIVLNDNLTSDETLSCEPTVSSLNDIEIVFRISFDKSDDEDYTIVFDKNLFSYKIISAKDLKTHSENNNEKVNMPLFPSPEPSVSCNDDLDFFKDFKNEFSAIVYTDALTSKSKFLTEPILCSQDINEFNLKDETSLSECDEKEQNVLYYNHLFSFNVIYPDDLKSNTDNDNDKIDIEQPLGDMSVLPIPNFDFVDMALPPRDQRHQYLRFEGLEYTGINIADFKERDRVCLLAELRGGYLRFEAHWLIACNIVGRSLAPEKGKHEAMISRGQFVAHLAEHFRLLTKQRLQGLTVIVRDLLVIDMADLAPQLPPAAGPTRSLPHRVAILEKEVHGCEGN
nr:hypothetical protein [Tanacetum cinerariifolium]